MLPLALKLLQLSRLRYLLLGNPDVGRSFPVTRGSGPCTRHWKGRNPSSSCAPALLPLKPLPFSWHLRQVLLYIYGQPVILHPPASAP